ncbi:hypothetical protein D3C79_1000660 [compost metagenome]
MTFQAALAKRQDGDDGEVPNTRDDQQFHYARVGEIDVLGVMQQFGVLNDAGQTGHLHHANELVTHWRDDDPHGLRQNDPLECLKAGHADGLRCLILAGVDG